MKKYLLVVIILAVVIVVLGGILLLPKNSPQNNSQNSNQQEAKGLQVKAPKLHEEISSPLKITGTTNGEGWNGFEGQVGTVKLLDNAGRQIGLAILQATTDWTKPPVSFEANLNFTFDKDQSGILVFSNENPSGLPENSKEFSLPVQIVKSSGETAKLKAYFNNSKMDAEYSCNKVFPVDREVPKTEAIARIALEELFKGPTDVEKNAGFFTSINQGVKIQSLKIENETAYADFDEQLEFQTGGSCKVSAIRAEITQTLKQFPTVKNVVISINGRTEDILQP